MKRILPLFLSLLMLFSLAACENVLDREQLYEYLEFVEEQAETIPDLGYVEEVPSESDAPASDSSVNAVTSVSGADGTTTTATTTTAQPTTTEKPTTTTTTTTTTTKTTTTTTVAKPTTTTTAQKKYTPPDEDGYYYDVKNVVLYIEEYGHLPYNYITKNEARDLGWSGGSVERYMDGGAIGGDRFGNYEGLLPKKSGRTYTECDIDTDGYGSRGARRLVFSNDGLYFYTSDHYESFDPVTVTENHEVVW